MVKPQQPEIARSGRGAVDPSAAKSDLTAPQPTAVDPAAGPVPEDNLPGHHPTQEQDKPTGEAFLQKLHEHATEADAAADTAEEPERTLAGEPFRAAADAVRKVREALPGDST